MSDPTHDRSNSYQTQPVSDPNDERSNSWKIHVMTTPTHDRSNSRQIQLMSDPTHGRSKSCQIQLMPDPTHVRSNPCQIQLLLNLNIPVRPLMRLTPYKDQGSTVIHSYHDVRTTSNIGIPVFVIANISQLHIGPLINFVEDHVQVLQRIMFKLCRGSCIGLAEDNVLALQRIVYKQRNMFKVYIYGMPQLQNFEIEICTFLNSTGLEL